MEHITLKFPAAWLEKDDHVVGFNPMATSRAALGSYVIIRRTRLAALASAAEAAKDRGPGYIHDMSDALAGIQKMIDHYLGQLDTRSAPFAKVSYGDGPDDYARQHLDSLSEEVAAITRQLATDQTVPKELVGERVLKVALAMLQRPRPEVGEIEPLVWQAFHDIRSALVEVNAALGMESPQEVAQASTRHLRTTSLRIKELDTMAFNTAKERDEAVAHLNGLLRGYYSGARAVEAEQKAKDWLTQKGFANYEPSPPEGR